MKRRILPEAPPNIVEHVVRARKPVVADVAVYGTNKVFVDKTMR